MALTLINNSDRVKVACLAQLVNVIAPIFTKKGGGVIRQSTFYPFRDVSRYGRGTALRAVVASPTVETVYGDAPVLHTAAVDDPESSTLTVFCLSIDEKEGHDLDLDLRSFGKVTMILREEMSGSDPDAVNTFDSPDLVRPVSLEPAKGPCERCAVRIRPLSWNVLRFKYSN